MEDVVKKNHTATQITSLELGKESSIECYCSDMVEGKTKNGGTYLNGTVLSGTALSIKVWGGSLLNRIVGTEGGCTAYVGKILRLTGKLDSYNGTSQFIVSALEVIEGNKVEFLGSPYDKDKYIEALKTLTNSTLSATGKKTLAGIFYAQPQLWDRFVTAFAAKSHHDNCVSGLLAHTYKVTRLVVELIGQYGNLLPKDPKEFSDAKDCIIIGAVIHDVGKIAEMELGVYQKYSFVSHRYLGVEMIAPYKATMIGLYSEGWYYHLVSILLQHHGEYEEHCKTVGSYLVNLADGLDAKCTSGCEAMANAKVTQAGKMVSFDGGYYTAF